MPVNAFSPRASHSASENAFASAAFCSSNFSLITRYESISSRNRTKKNTSAIMVAVEIVPLLEGHRPAVSKSFGRIVDPQCLPTVLGTFVAECGPRRDRDGVNIPPHGAR